MTLWGATVRIKLTPYGSWPCVHMWAERVWRVCFTTLMLILNFYPRIIIIIIPFLIITKTYKVLLTQISHNIMTTSFSIKTAPSHRGLDSTVWSDTFLPEPASLWPSVGSDHTGQPSLSTCTGCKIYFFVYQPMAGECSKCTRHSTDSHCLLAGEWRKSAISLVAGANFKLCTCINEPWTHEPVAVSPAFP